MTGRGSDGALRSAATLNNVKIRCLTTNLPPDDGKLFTRLVKMPSSSAESGLRWWEKQIWRLPFENAISQRSTLNIFGNNTRLPRRSPWLAEALRRWLGEGG